MKYVSDRRRRLVDAARPIREGLLARNDRCWICGHGPRNPWRRKPRECSELSVHEIARGPHRERALGRPEALLVTCWWCNSQKLTDRRKWPEARQLAALKRHSPKAYDLEAYNRLVRPRAPNRITEEEVDRYRETLHF